MNSIYRNSAELSMSTEVYKILAHVYYAPNKGGLSKNAIHAIFTIYLYFATSFFPDD
jgi:hypothetical protein